MAAVGEKDIPALLEAFPEDTYDLSIDAIREAVRHQTQFNIIHPASGLKIDVMIMRDTAFDKSRLARRRRIHRNWVEKKIRRHLARARLRQGFGWKMRSLQERVVRENRMLRARWRELVETGPRTSLAGHEGGNPGYRQGKSCG